VAYLALPARLFEATVSAIADAGLARGSTIAIERPFGDDLASARRLDDLLHTRLPNVTAFRVDHFLSDLASRAHHFAQFQQPLLRGVPSRSVRARPASQAMWSGKPKRSKSSTVNRSRARPCANSVIKDVISVTRAPSRVSTSSVCAVKRFLSDSQV